MMTIMTRMMSMKMNPGEERAIEAREEDIMRIKRAEETQIGILEASMMTKKIMMTRIMMKRMKMTEEEGGITGNQAFALEGDLVP
jgi:hypothetical protein